jgi:hypothetical protein
MKSVHVVAAIKQFALHRGILKNIAAFANFKLLKVRTTYHLHKLELTSCLLKLLLHNADKLRIGEAEVRYSRVWCASARYREQ